MFSKCLELQIARWIVTIHRLDQTDGASGDQIVEFNLWPFAMAPTRE
jgi:hypothetical protein